MVLIGCGGGGGGSKSREYERDERCGAAVE